MKRHSAPKPKTVSYELIPEKQDLIGEPMYDLLRELVDAHHEELREARIALAWATSWKPDVDGHVTIGRCQKASDLSREFAPYDFVILLSKGFWQSLEVTKAQRRALLDHELCHGGRAYDKNGEPKVDARGRPVFRLRKHDIEEFSAIVERHGIYKRDLQQFAAALRRSALDGFKPCEACADSPGFIPTDGGHRMTRCPCWVAWQQSVAEAEPDRKSA